MTVVQMKCFVAVVKELNFAKAAKQLYISQPAVTHHIQMLEKELGVQLFIRMPRSVRLTTAGQVLFEEAEDILRRMDQAVQRVTHAAESDTLTVGCVTTLNVKYLPSIYREYREKCPDVQINMLEISHVDLKKMLEDETLDVVFSSRELHQRVPEFEYRSLNKNRLVCVTAPGHRLNQGPVWCKDLTGETLIMLNSKQCPPLMNHVQQQILSRCSGIHTTISSASTFTIPMVLGGVGIAIMPDFVIPDRTEAICVPFVLDDPLEKDFDFGIIYPRGELPRKVKQFIHTARNVYEANTTAKRKSITY